MTDSRKEDAERTRWRELVKRTIVSQFGAAVVAGSPQRAYVRDLGLNDEQIFDGYDVVDNAFFSDGAAAAKRLRDEARNLPGPTGPGQATPFFLSSGRMIRRKDHLTLIEGYRRYRASVSDPWRLILLGDGALRPEIERVISEEQIRGVTLAGWQPYDSLPVYYGLASGFIHTAVIDQWGLVVNEALAAGVPVIVSLGTGCVDDLVKGRGTGYTFAPGDAGELADCMVALSSDLEKRAMMSARAGEIVSEWSLDRFAESMLGASEIARSAAHGGSGLARLLLRAVDAASRDLTSFHSVES